MLVSCHNKSYFPVFLQLQEKITFMTAEGVARNVAEVNGTQQKGCGNVFTNGRKNVMAGC